MTAVVASWFIVKILITIGIVVVIACFLIFTKDGRVMLAWIAGIGAAIGGAFLIGSLFFLLIGAAVVWLLYQLILIFI